MIVSTLDRSTSLNTAPKRTVRVVGVTDGDTITVLVDRRQVRVGLAEIDTPERRQPYGTRAKQALSSLVFGKDVRVVEVDHERYGRTVGRVCADNADVNAEMVREGHAWVLPRVREPSASAEGLFARPFTRPGAACTDSRNASSSFGSPTSHVPACARALLARSSPAKRRESRRSLRESCA